MTAVRVCSRPMRLSMMLAVIVAGISACNKCMRPGPEPDTSPPLATVQVMYRDLDGSDKTRFLDVDDADISIVADKDHPIVVEYAGADTEGLRVVELAYDMWYYSGLQRISPTLLAIKKEADCPLGAIVERYTFDPDGTAWRYKFSTRATSWDNLQSTSGTVNVEAR